MRRMRWLLISIVLVAGACDGAPKPTSQETVGKTLPELALQPVFSQFSFKAPVALLQPPSDSSVWFLVEQGGKVKKFKSGDTTTQAYIDLSDFVTSGGEKGLLGMAFHPDFATNQFVYLSYTKGNKSYISRFTEQAGVLSKSSLTVILELEQPYSNHNGGQIEFGQDGYLYIGFGDGGSAGDPLGHGQNINSLLGAMLRIDVDKAVPYGIPADNPFANGGGRGEIYAYGLRNPWRWSFDSKTGELWVGDVGQNQWEEIDLIVKGGNYGWNVREGAHCFGASNCSTTNLIDPVFEYSHQLGVAVTGGYVYRGSVIPTLVGTYIFGDFGSGVIWGLQKNTTGGFDVKTLIASSGAQISSFAQGRDGELYVLNYGNGQVLKIIAK